MNSLAPPPLGTSSLSESPARLLAVHSSLAAVRDPNSVCIPSPSTHSDQFEDAPEDIIPHNLPARLNPLEALAFACAAENKKDVQNVNHNSVTPSNGAASTVAFTDPNNFLIAHNDVLCGRGGLTNHHPGNVFFRRLVRIKQEAYLLASKRDKAGVAKEIVELVRALDPPGRFLKKDTKGTWTEIGDRKAREKTSQALREGAPELRDDLHTVGVGATDEAPIPSVSAGSRAAIEQLRVQELNRDERWSEQPTSAVANTMTRPGEIINNRARVVSDDAGVLGIRPLFHQIQGQHSPHIVVDDRHQFHSRDVQRHHNHHQQLLYTPHMIQSNLIGFPEQHAGQHFLPSRPKGVPSKAGSKRKINQVRLVQEGHVHDAQDEGSKRGPRVKLLKSRLEECTI